MNKNIPNIFFTSANTPELKARTALTQRGSSNDGDAVKITRAEFEEGVRELALGLMALGIDSGSRIAILQNNNPDWIISDLAILSIGAVTVPIYTTLGAAEMLYILNDAEVSAIICSNAHLKKLLKISDEALLLKHIISTEDVSDSLTNKDILSIEQLRALGRESGDLELLNKRIEGISPEDTFSIIYSSGTTGRAKGVALSHQNLISNIENVLKVVDVRSSDCYLSYLPLSHVFERMVHHLLVYLGAKIAYSRGFAFVGADTTFFRPSFMVGVPFYFERLMEKIKENISKAGKVKASAFEIAMNLKLPILSSILDTAVLSKIREKACPGLRFYISGGAALGIETAEFFNNLGIPVLQGYGLTETSPVATINTIDSDKIGTVGKAIPGVEIKIAEDGEVLIKGHCIMQGYLNMPEANREAIIDNWFKSGDLGSLDNEGYLTITGRKKDLIITSVGKNISPQKIEALLKADDYIKEVVVFGDNRPHLVAIIFPEIERLTQEGITEPKAKPTVKTDTKTIITDKALHRFFEKKLRSRLKGLARFEQIRRFNLINGTLSTKGGELTPTLKIKRSNVKEKYNSIIEALYDN
jgi:long-chain acyl-CoA synthetase